MRGGFWHQSSGGPDSSPDMLEPFGLAKTIRNLINRPQERPRRPFCSILRSNSAAHFVIEDAMRRAHRRPRVSGLDIPSRSVG